MGRSTKPLQLIKSEGNKRHLTKKEMDLREKHEKSLLTGIPFKEWEEVKQNEVSHKEFTRLKKLLKVIGKDDGLYESVINRYCLLHGECSKLQVIKKGLYSDLEELPKQNFKYFEKIEAQKNLQNAINQCESAIMKKRKMLFDIEKENLLTLQSALRSIPKKVEEPEEESPMAKLLREVDVRRNKQ